MIVGRLLRELRSASWPDLFSSDPTRIPGPGEGSSTWSGVPVTEESALTFGAVFSCVGLLTDTLAQLPVGVFTKENGVAVPVDAPPATIREPHPEMEWIEWISRLAYSYEMRGNSYGIVEGWFDRGPYAGWPRLVRPFHPDEIHPFRDQGRIRYRTRGYNTALDQAEVLHVKGLTPPGIDRLEGFSTIALARHTIGTALAATEYGARFFRESAVPSGMLTTKENLDEDDAKRWSDAWEKSQGSRHRKTAVLGGGLEFKTLTIKPEEAQFIQTIKAKKGDVAGWWRVPPHLIGDVERSTSWGSGIEEQNLMFIAHTIGIRILKFERLISRLLLPPDQYLKFNVAGLLRMRLTEQFKAFLMARHGGWMNIDEIRDKLEMAPLPDGKGQDHISPMNFNAIPAGGLAEVLDPTKDDDPAPPASDA